MQISLNRAELFTLAALLRATSIIGLDPSTLLPESAAERQALYNAGEASLAKRGLIRIVESAEVQLEENVQRMMLAVTQPQTAIISAKTVPGTGQQLFLHYGRDDAYVEHTLPDATSHRLADVGGVTELRDRLAEIFPLPRGASNAGFELDTGALLAAYNFARLGDAGEANKAMAQNGPVDQIKASFMASIVNLQFSGTLAMIQVVPDQVNEARELAVFAGAGRAWLAIAADDAKSRIGAADAASFIRTLDVLLTALNTK